MPEFNSSLLAIASILLLAGVVQGMTGFGFSLVATPLLAVVMSLKDASNLVLFFIFFTSFVGIYHLRRQINWKWRWDFVAGVTFGVVVGGYLLIKADETILKRLLGGALITFSIHEIFFSKRVPMTFVRNNGLSFGLCSGALAGAFNMGGPPAVVFAYSQPWKKEEVVVQLQIIFLAAAVMRAIFVGVYGDFRTPILVLSAWCSLPVLIGTYAGLKLFRIIPEQKLRFLVFAFLGMLGMKFAFWG
jgi:uncharacterized protein